jgi:CheY-like chemotaxis protein
MRFLRLETWCAVMARVMLCRIDTTPTPETTTLSKKVLVVDDDTSLQETLEAILDYEGYEVTVARDGLEALAMLDETMPRLILLDLMMPRMDGYAFAEELALRGLRPRIPILILTADGRAEQKARQVAAEGYLEKPFDVMSLLDEVNRLLENSG